MSDIPFIPELGFTYYLAPDNRYYRATDSWVFWQWLGHWAAIPARGYSETCEWTQIAGPNQMDDWRPSWAVLGRS